MTKSKNRRKNGRVKKYVQKDAAGFPVKARNKRHIREARFKQMMRVQLLHTACQSLTSSEVKMAMDKGKGHEMSYVSTKLDENGVPTSGETKTIKLSKIDIDRLESIYQSKLASEEQMKHNAEKEE